MKLILVGGFLGAGKTTLLYHAAQRLALQGHNVGLITNDQAPDLVDTALLTNSGAGVREVAGSCFCCNFEGLMQAIRSLTDAGATHILAEPVGSCTDLAATILQPMRQLHLDIDLAPLTVLVDPQRLRDTLQHPNTTLDPDAVYILRLQLMEADQILLTKTDTLSPARREEAMAYLAAEFPHARVATLALPTSSDSQPAPASELLDAWLSAMLAPPASPPGQHIVPVDYDRYAHGEAVLGWLNATYDLRWIDGLAPRWEEFAQNFLALLQHQFRDSRVEVGHVKLLLDTGAQSIAANLTSVNASPAKTRTVAKPGASNEEKAPPTLNAILTLNARAQCAPQALQSICQTALNAATYGRIAATHRTHHALSPGRPTPTHRFAGIKTATSSV